AKKTREWYLLVVLFVIGEIYGVEYFGPDDDWAWLIELVLYVFLGPLVFLHLQSLRQAVSLPLVWRHIAFPILVGASLFILQHPAFMIRNEMSEIVFRFQLFLIFMSMMMYAGLLLLQGQAMKLGNAKVDVKWVRWQRNLSIAFIVFIVINFGKVFFTRYYEDGIWLYLIESTVTCGLFTWLVWYALHYRLWCLQNPAEMVSDKPQQKWNELFVKMDTLVREEQLFLEKNLKLDDLSRRMNSNNRYVSKAVNVVAEMSFTQYINHLRLSCFKEKLISPKWQHLTIDALAADSGFQSTSTLNRIFKQEEGVSPSVYRQNIEKSGSS
ncbi:MAG: AraC family transcriptional regulator, partial [Bacteroidota bacterium]